MREQVHSGLAADVTRRLLDDDVDANGIHHAKRAVGFRTLMLDFIRMHLIGERFEDRRHGVWLDGLIESLERVAEPPKISGRIYSSSTVNDRESLTGAWLACLLAYLPDEGDDGAVDAIAKLTEREEALPNDDQTLRGLLRKLEEARKYLEPENQDYLLRGASALKPDIEFEGRVDRLAAIFDDAINRIKAQRLERLRQRPVSQARLDAVRDQIEQALVTGDGGIEIFRGFKIEQIADALTERQCSVNDINKGYLTDPLMDDPSNLWDVIASWVQDSAAAHVWRYFAKLPRKVVTVEDEASYLAALTQEAQRIRELRMQPILLVRDLSDPPWIREWFSWRQTPRDGLRTERKQELRTGDYFRTANDIDVYGGGRNGILLPAAGESLLFPAQLLKAVRYGAATGDHVVNVEFVEGQDAETGLLRFRFSQGTEWTKDEVIVFRTPTSASIETSS